MSVSLPVLGILGGGQLGRMTALAATRLGVTVRILADHESGTGRPLAGVTVADWPRFVAHLEAAYAGGPTPPCSATGPPAATP